MEEWRQILIQKIETAFAETPFPERQGFSVSGYSFETAGIEGKHWRELELGLLSSACNEMYHFGAEVRFYLPAFLRAAVLHPQEMDMLQDPLLYLFAPPRPDD